MHNGKNEKYFKIHGQAINKEIYWRLSVTVKKLSGQVEKNIKYQVAKMSSLGNLLHYN